MSIRDDAYQLCKAVWKAPSLERLRNLLWSLNRTSEADRDTDRDRAQFGYLARRQSAQFLGYLLVDQRRTEIEQGPYPFRIPYLSDAERQILAGAHKQIALLNERSLEPLLQALPQCARAVDPYNRFEYVESADVAEIDILAPLNIEAMARSFHNHPAIAIAVSTANVIQVSMTEEEYAQAVIGFTKSLTEIGVMQAPDELKDIAFRHGEHTPERLTVRYVAALAGIRDSLANLDQLVFQAVLTNKLPLLSEENIISIDHINRHVVGTGSFVVFQFDDQVGFPGPGELILFKIALPNMPIDQLCRVENMRLSLNQELGESTQVELREVDAHLNSFGALLQHI